MRWGEADGLIKTVFGPQTGTIVGTYTVCAEVAEVIHGYVGKLH